MWLRTFTLLSSHTLVQVVTPLSPRSPGVDPRPLYVGSVMDKCPLYTAALCQCCISIRAYFIYPPHTHTNYHIVVKWNSRRPSIFSESAFEIRIVCGGYRTHRQQLLSAPQIVPDCHGATLHIPCFHSIASFMLKWSIYLETRRLFIPC